MNHFNHLGVSLASLVVFLSVAYYSVSRTNRRIKKQIADREYFDIKRHLLYGWGPPDWERIRVFGQKFINSRESGEQFRDLVYNARMKGIKVRVDPHLRAPKGYRGIYIQWPKK
jgi:hypothetical protein